MYVYIYMCIYIYLCIYVYQFPFLTDSYGKCHFSKLSQESQNIPHHSCYQPRRPIDQKNIHYHPGASTREAHDRPHGRLVGRSWLAAELHGTCANT